jgi:dihydropteroate synthase
MGIINLSPDSFYGDSYCGNIDETLRVAENMLRGGASILDIGAESSRPGSSPITEAEEIGRLLPVVVRLVKEFDVTISVDTYKPAVIEAVLGEGATLINDITGLQQSPQSAGIIASHNAGVIVMHMRGNPLTMQIAPQYENLMEEVITYLGRSIQIAESAGIDHIIIDPGIGFGKTAEHNLELVRNLSQFKRLNKPILLGASRKSFIGKMLDLPVEDRLEASLAVAVIGVMNGANIVRAHDVPETVKALDMAQVILNGN